MVASRDARADGLREGEAMPVVNANAAGFDIGNAYWCAKLAQLAYCDANDIALSVRSWGYGSVVSVEAGDTQAFVARDDATAVIAFRGTQPTDLQDWMTDLRVRLEPDPILGGAQVHRGFRDALDLVWTNLAAASQNCSRLWLAGHSLGGALATLAAARFARQRPGAVAGVFTYGCPRTGSLDFAKAYDKILEAHSFRFVNDKDLVPRVPKRVMGHWHVGTLAHFNGDGDLSMDVNASPNLLKRLVGGAIEDFLDLGPKQIADHSMTNYVRNLAALVKSPGRVPAAPAAGQQMREYA